MWIQENLQLGTKEEIANIILTQIYSTNYINNIQEITSNLEDGDLIEGDTYFSNVTFKEILDNSVILYNVCYQIIEQAQKEGKSVIVTRKGKPVVKLLPLDSQKTFD
jgi:hypothetical protein